ncbi:hypothetical protein SAMN04487939_11190 [Lysobacter sp. yr284]|uniref:hypothetical protein n=1 Tax=Lysobacter sp. yr284 TaxID=1761791 RepID=UPI00089D218E|nr:hypothetical protein [Lysobacter sp. yr284]SDY99773.1 hypothetical protein SAMN04487939_11190 [Lysobacter sp. yr284]
MFRPMFSLSVFVLFVCAGTSHAASTPFVVVRQTIDSVMAPKTPIDVFVECANNATCRGLADAGGSYLGMQPGEISAALARVPAPRRAGEESWISIELPTGYQYCRSSIRTISVVPASGDRASVMGATSNPRGVGVYTWTPKGKFGDGRSWVEAEYTVYGVRDDLAERKRAQGACRPIGGELISCRGARGVNKGMPACGLKED